jgi:branched-chain amino acid transport system substrate-binding protein
VISQYAELGLKLPIIGKYGITDEAFLQKLGDAAVGIVAAGQWSAALDNPVNRRVRDAFEAKHKRAMTLTVEQAYVGAQMLAKALETARGDVENLDGLLAALKSVEVEGPRGKVRLDAFHNPLHAVYMFKTERKGGVLQNTPIASVPNVSQFWTWSPEEYMALPSYVEMKGKWAK